jgi:hypothetical protein
MPIFAKMLIFAKTSIFAKMLIFLAEVFKQKLEGSGKVCKNREKSFSWNSIFVNGFGEFCRNLIGFLQKKICKHFCNVCHIIPMG